MKQTILLLEDDPNLGFVLQEHLEANGYGVRLKTNGVEGLAAAQREAFDLCLVDVMMPKKDGFTFAREFRARDQKTPLVFLTAKSLKEDRVEGFKIGADDYVTKPFSMEELLLRIRAVLKRTAMSGEASSASGPQSVGKFRFDPSRQTLESSRRKVNLTATETQLFELLLLHRNEVVPRGDILKKIWGDDSYFNGRSLDVFVSKLRKHLARDPSVRILNVRGKGYRLTAPSSRSQS